MDAARPYKHRWALIALGMKQKVAVSDDGYIKITQIKCGVYSKGRIQRCTYRIEKDPGADGQYTSRTDLKCWGQS